MRRRCGRRSGYPSIGYTVEAGVVKTARVRFGDNGTIGLGSVIEIGVEIGSDAQVGALSFVPKYLRLEGGVAYAGTPAMPLEYGSREPRPRACRGMSCAAIDCVAGSRCLPRQSSAGFSAHRELLDPREVKSFI